MKHSRSLAVALTSLAVALLALLAGLLTGGRVPLVDPAARAEAAEAPAPPPLPPVILSPVDPLGALPSAPAEPQRGEPETNEGDGPVRTFGVRVTDPETIERTLVAQINRLRRARGLSVLRVSPQLSRAADEHSRSLAYTGQFTHDWPSDGRSFARWMPAFYPSRGYRRWYVGENLFWMALALSPKVAMQQWLASPPHRKILLTSDWREVGVGVVNAYGAPGTYSGYDVAIVAAEFGVRRS